MDSSQSTTNNGEVELESGSKDNEEIQVTFKMLNGNQFTLTLPKEVGYEWYNMLSHHYPKMIRILDLKHRVATHCQVEVSLQRFIFQGRSLDDDEAQLSRDCHVQDQHVIHLVFKKPSIETIRSAGEQSSTDTAPSSETSYTNPNNSPSSLAGALTTQLNVLVHAVSFPPQTIFLTVLQPPQELSNQSPSNTNPSTTPSETIQPRSDNMVLPLLVDLTTAEDSSSNTNLTSNLPMSTFSQPNPSSSAHPTPSLAWSTPGSSTHANISFQSSNPSPSLSDTRILQRHIEEFSPWGQIRTRLNSAPTSDHDSLTRESPNTAVTTATQSSAVNTPSPHPFHPLSASTSILTGSSSGPNVNFTQRRRLFSAQVLTLIRNHMQHMPEHVLLQAAIQPNGPSWRSLVRLLILLLREHLSWISASQNASHPNVATSANNATINLNHTHAPLTFSITSSQPIPVTSTSASTATASNLATNTVVSTSMNQLDSTYVPTSVIIVGGNSPSLSPVTRMLPYRNSLLSHLQQGFSHHQPASAGSTQTQTPPTHINQALVATMIQSITNMLMNPNQQVPSDQHTQPSPFSTTDNMANTPIDPTGVLSPNASPSSSSTLSETESISSQTITSSDALDSISPLVTTAAIAPLTPEGDQNGDQSSRASTGIASPVAATLSAHATDWLDENAARLGTAATSSQTPLNSMMSSLANSLHPLSLSPSREPNSTHLGSLSLSPSSQNETDQHSSLNIESTSTQGLDTSTPLLITSLITEQPPSPLANGDASHSLFPTVGSAVPLSSYDQATDDPAISHRPDANATHPTPPAQDASRLNDSTRALLVSDFSSWCSRYLSSIDWQTFVTPFQRASIELCLHRTCSQLIAHYELLDAQSPAVLHSVPHLAYTQFVDSICNSFSSLIRELILVVEGSSSPALIVDRLFPDHVFPTTLRHALSQYIFLQAIRCKSESEACQEFKEILMQERQEEEMRGTTSYDITSSSDHDDISSLPSLSLSIDSSQATSVHLVLTDPVTEFSPLHSSWSSCDEQEFLSQALGESEESHKEQELDEEEDKPGLFKGPQIEDGIEMNDVIGHYASVIHDEVAVQATNFNSSSSSIQGDDSNKTVDWKVVDADRQKQAVQLPQRPFSDAYLSGQPSCLSSTSSTTAKVFNSTNDANVPTTTSSILSRQLGQALHLARTLDPSNAPSLRPNMTSSFSTCPSIEQEIFTSSQLPLPLVESYRDQLRHDLIHMRLDCDPDYLALQHTSEVPFSNLPPPSSWSHE